MKTLDNIILIIFKFLRFTWISDRQLIINTAISDNSNVVAERLQAWINGSIIAVNTGENISDLSEIGTKELSNIFIIDFYY